MARAPVLAGAFFKSSSIVADWGKLLGQLYWFVFMELRGLGLDTGFCWVFGGLQRERATATAVDQFFSWPVWPVVQFRQELAGEDLPSCPGGWFVEENRQSKSNEQ